ncbi:hypothetical protein ABZ864_29755 [Streptomyces sp. NPDC047082]|uniref:hypothetical protein n=1 Tax=Streptomyces sp. NPDC047082 TaxID=3155259 RepID=UPI0033D168EC
MQLKDIRLSIEKSTNEDWHFINCWGGGSGPSFHNKYEWALELDSHHSTLIYRENVALTIAWGINTNKGMRPSWLNSFGNDSSADYQIGDIFWNGALIDRYYLASVDGGRVLLPVPTAVCKDIADSTATRYEVTHFHRAFARLIDRSRPVADFDRCYADAGFITVSNPW